MTDRTSPLITSVATTSRRPERACWTAYCSCSARSLRRVLDWETIFGETGCYGQCHPWLYTMRRSRAMQALPCASHTAVP